MIIPKQYWEWDDQSKVFIRFGNTRLGEWEVDVGHFVPRYFLFTVILLHTYTVCSHRDIDDTMCEMTCKLKIDPVILKRCIPYKYVILTSKSSVARFEFLRLTSDSSKEPINRVLNFGSLVPTLEGEFEF